MEQEYGRYFDMQTSVFRFGTLTGPNHSAAELHGFLAYVMRCTMTGSPYRVYGYQGKQVRDAIHSADLISCFDYVQRAAAAGVRRYGEVYNIGGRRFSNCMSSKQSTCVRTSPGAHWNGATSMTNASETTSGESAITDTPPNCTPAGGSPTTYPPSSPRCTTPTAIAGRHAEHDFSSQPSSSVLTHVHHSGRREHALPATKRAEALNEHVCQVDILTALRSTGVGVAAVGGLRLTARQPDRNST